MKEELISVIVPVYKVEQYLDRCINSIINQTYKNLEVVLINDGSPDNCPKMCEDWAKKDNRIKVLHKENGGLMAAWIDGVKIASGKYISFVDSDDWCELNMIEELYKPFVEHDVDLSICGLYESRDKKRMCLDSNKLNFCGLYEGENLNQVKESSVIHPNFDIALFRCNKMFKKSTILNNLKYCDTRATISEDSCIVQASLLEAKSIYFSNKYLYNYYFREDSMIHKYNIKMNEKCEIYFEMFKKLYYDKVSNPEIGLTFERVRLLNMLVKNILKSKEGNKKQLLEEISNLNIVKEIDQEIVKSTLGFKAKSLYFVVLKKSLTKLKILHFLQEQTKKLSRILLFFKGKIKKYTLDPIIY